MRDATKWKILLGSAGLFFLGWMQHLRAFSGPSVFDAPPGTMPLLLAVPLFVSLLAGCAVAGLLSAILEGLRGPDVEGRGPSDMPPFGGN